MVKIGVDVMGGDNPPELLIKGCIQASNELDTCVVIIGDEELVQRELHTNSYDKEKIQVLPSTEIISMHDNAVKAIRQKYNSSIMVGCRALKQSAIDILISPGNTGATLAAALFEVGRIKGVKRPAIALSLPTDKGHCLFLDGGANMDCNYKYIKQFALMGAVHYRYMNDIPSPRIGLLNVGEEKHKGNELTLKVHKELEKLPHNFIGNVEPRDVYAHKADVVVADGFVGNIMLKNIEGTARFVTGIIKKNAGRSLASKLGALLLKSSFNEIRTKLSPTSYGAEPLLGINHPVYIGHGSSNDESIYNAIKKSLYGIKHHITEHIHDEIKQWG